MLRRRRMDAIVTASGGGAIPDRDGHGFVAETAPGASDAPTCACRHWDARDCIEARYPCTCHWEGGSEHLPDCWNDRDIAEPCSCRCHDERDDEDEIEPIDHEELSMPLRGPAAPEGT